MNSLQSILEEKIKNKGTESPKNSHRGIHNEWQNKAFIYAEKMNIKIERKFMSRYLKIFKEASVDPKKSAKLEKAYRYLADYKKEITNEHKANLFLWLINRKNT